MQLCIVLEIICTYLSIVGARTNDLPANSILFDLNAIACLHTGKSRYRHTHYQSISGLFRTDFREVHSIPRSWWYFHGGDVQSTETNLYWWYGLFMKWELYIYLYYSRSRVSRHFETEVQSLTAHSLDCIGTWTWFAGQTFRAAK